jgi:hypothetical protein
MAARSPSAASGPRTRHRSAVRSCRHPAQQQGALRHVPPGPGRCAGAHRLPSRIYRGGPHRRSGRQVAELRALTSAPWRSRSTRRTPSGKRRPLPHRAPRGRGQSRRDRVPRADVRGDARFSACSRGRRRATPAAPPSSRASRRAGANRHRDGHIWPVTSDNTRATRSPPGVTGCASTSPPWLGVGFHPLSQALAGIPRDGRSMTRSIQASRRAAGRFKCSAVWATVPRSGPPTLAPGGQDCGRDRRPAHVSALQRDRDHRTTQPRPVRGAAAPPVCSPRIFQVLNHLMRVAGRAHAAGACHGLPGAQDDAQPHAGAAGENAAGSRCARTPRTVGRNGSGSPRRAAGSGRRRSPPRAGPMKPDAGSKIDGPF